MGNSGLDHLPPNHWARGRARGNYLIAGTLLALAGATYTYTMYSVQNKVGAGHRHQAREGKDKETGARSSAGRDAGRTRRRWSPSRDLPLLTLE